MCIRSPHKSTRQNYLIQFNNEFIVNPHIKIDRCWTNIHCHHYNGLTSLMNNRFWFYYSFVIWHPMLYDLTSTWSRTGPFRTWLINDTRVVTPTPRSLISSLVPWWCKVHNSCYLQWFRSILHSFLQNNIPEFLLSIQQFLLKFNLDGFLAQTQQCELDFWIWNTQPVCLAYCNFVAFPCYKTGKRIIVHIRRQRSFKHRPGIQTLAAQV